LDYEPWPVPTTLPEKLRAARLRRGWSIKRSAATLGVDEATFGRWEKGGLPGRQHIAAVEGFVE